jgi:hypothetical protein
VAESTKRFCQLGIVAALGLWISCIVNDVDDVCQRLKAGKLKVTGMHLTIKIAALRVQNPHDKGKEPFIFAKSAEPKRTWFV